MTRAVWPHAFRATLRAEPSAIGLTTSLTVENLGAERFEFTAALHSYLWVSDVYDVRIEGLMGPSFMDATQGMTEFPETQRALSLQGEVDRVHVSVSQPLYPIDRNEKLGLTQTGFEDVVIRNPGDGTFIKNC